MGESRGEKKLMAALLCSCVGEEAKYGGGEKKKATALHRVFECGREAIVTELRTELPLGCSPGPPAKLD